MRTHFKQVAALLLAGAALLAGGPLRSQEAAGEVRLSPTGSEPAVAASGRGFVVVWTEASAQRQGIFGIRLLPGGGVRSAPFRVDTPDPGRHPNRPDVAVSEAGGFVVVWQDDMENYSSVPEVGGSRVLGQQFGAGGGRQGSNFRLSRAEVGQQITPWVAVGEDGDILTSWTESSGVRRILAARFSANGARLGPELRLPAGGRNDEFNYGVGVARYPGGFAVGWQEVFDCHQGQPGGSQGAIARFGPDGRRAGRVLRVGDVSCVSQTSASFFSLVGSRAGALAVFYDGRYFAQRFGPSGEAVGGRIPLPSCVQARCANFAVAALDDSGRFAVIWETNESSSFNLFAQLFSAQGKPLTGFIRVNDSQSTFYEDPDAALANDGTLVVVWQRRAPLPDDNGLFLKVLQLP
jgi:hypothetical protein